MKSGDFEMRSPLPPKNTGNALQEAGKLPFTKTLRTQHNYGSEKSTIVENLRLKSIRQLIFCMRVAKLRKKPFISKELG